MKKLIIVFTLFAAFSACQKDCERDKTGTLIFRNVHQQQAVTMIFPASMQVIEPGEKYVMEYDLCPPGTPCDNSAQVSFSYRWQDREETQSVSTFPAVCETVEVIIDR